jgi:hypothetical protein
VALSILGRPAAEAAAPGFLASPLDGPSPHGAKIMLAVFEKLRQKKREARADALELFKSVVEELVDLAPDDELPASRLAQIDRVLTGLGKSLHDLEAAVALKKRRREFAKQLADKAPLEKQLRELDGEQQALDEALARFRDETRRQAAALQERRQVIDGQLRAIHSAELALNRELPPALIARRDAHRFKHSELGPELQKLREEIRGEREALEHFENLVSKAKDNPTARDADGNRISLPRLESRVATSRKGLDVLLARLAPLEAEEAALKAEAEEIARLALIP